MTTRVRWLILGFALVGLAFAGMSTWVHYRLLTDPTYVSPCDINQTFNCSQVYLSRFGSVQGVPVALGGVIWFALVALVAGLSRPRETGTNAEAKAEGAATGEYVFVLATVGLAAILYLGYASFFVLKTACVLCIGTYVSVIGIFVVSGLTTSMAMTRLPLRFFSDLRTLSGRPVVLVVAILYIAGAASVVAFFPKEVKIQTAPPPPPPADAQKTFESAWVQQPRVDLGIPAGGAKVVIVKFNDWLCPGCKGYEEAYKPILDKYEKTMPGAVKFIRKDWPWNTNCNFNIAMTIKGHEATCEAAASVRIARDHGKGDEMAAWLFDNQTRLIEMEMRGTGAPDTIKAELAKLTGVTDFDRQYQAKLPDIRRDVADGGALQVHSTPTYFVNGVRTTDATTAANLPPEYLDLAIQYELKKAASTSGSGRGGGT